jgi:hypothetical protein
VLELRLLSRASDYALFLLCGGASDTQDFSSRSQYTQLYRSLLSDGSRVAPAPGTPPPVRSAASAVYPGSPRRWVRSSRSQGSRLQGINSFESIVSANSQGTSSLASAGGRLGMLRVLHRMRDGSAASGMPLRRPTSRQQSRQVTLSSQGAALETELPVSVSASERVSRLSSSASNLQRSASESQASGTGMLLREPIWQAPLVGSQEVDEGASLQPSARGPLAWLESHLDFIVRPERASGTDGGSCTPPGTCALLPFSNPQVPCQSRADRYQVLFAMGA